MNPPNPNTIEIRIREHEYAPWRGLEVRADYTRDNLGFLHFVSRDGRPLRPVRRANARQRNAARTLTSMRRRWVRLPG